MKYPSGQISRFQQAKQTFQRRNIFRKMVERNLLISKKSCSICAQLVRGMFGGWVRDVLRRLMKAVPDMINMEEAHGRVQMAGTLFSAALICNLRYTVSLFLDIIRLNVSKPPTTQNIRGTIRRCSQIN